MLTLIAIVSSAGGAGRSTVSAHLATQLARGDHPVALLELDAQNSVGALLGLTTACQTGVLTAGDAPNGWQPLVCETPANVPLLPAGPANAAANSALGNDLMQMIQARGGDAIVPVRIHRDDAVGAAAASGKALLEHTEGSQAALDIVHLAAWVLRATARPGEVIADSDASPDAVDRQEGRP
jgi:cellulose biosynthesis protein BcsQ